MTSLLNKLDYALKSSKEEQIVDVLKHIIEVGKDFHLNDARLVANILGTENKVIQELSVQLIAELAKNEENRRVLSQETIINSLISVISQSNSKGAKNNAFRALGNICYENDDARKLVGKNGFDRILSVLNSASFDTSLDLNASGFLMNFLNSGESFQKHALQNNILKTCESFLVRNLDSCPSESLYMFLLTVINTVIDFLEECEISFPESLCSTIVRVFKKSSDNPEISLLCLEILHSQSEKDEIKVVLAREGACDLVIEEIEKYKDQVNDEESRSVLKTACDLIVIVLTGDLCMNLLYNNGKGNVYESMIKWLNSDDIDILSTGILALGNFARKDEHCIQMVKSNKVSRKLIEILQNYNKIDSDVKVQHALLSTLKNLVIPRPNKAEVLKEGLIEAVYPLIESDQYMVIFKLLGTLRMVTDQQENVALDLLSRRDFLKRLMYWCYNSDHLGVRGEVPRLLSWLIVNSKHHNTETLKIFNDYIEVDGSVKCIVEMISSNFAVMQNEAFHSLYLLWICCSHLNTSDGNEEKLLNDSDNRASHSESESIVTLGHLLVEADIGKHLNFILNKYGGKMDKCLIQNMLRFLELIIHSNEVLEHLKTTNVSEGITNLLQNANSQDSTEKINCILREIRI